MVTDALCKCGRSILDGVFCSECGIAATICDCERVPRVVPDPASPMAVARQFVNERYAEDDALLVRHHRGSFYIYDGAAWPEGEDRRMRADFYCWLEDAVYEKEVRGDTVLVPFDPTRHKVQNALEALQAIAHLDAAVTPPAWLTDDDLPAAQEVVAMSNGLLHLPSRQLLAHSARYFTLHSLPFAYDEDALAPVRWQQFLREVWQDDDESIDTLAEVMGYILSGRTFLQKLFMLVGPKRSGKGTIGRVLTGLLGPHNVAAPTLQGLTTNFGLSPIVGRPLAIVSDARLSSRADSMIAVERLLSISGEDTLTIDRKYREPWTGRLNTRFLIMTNEIPRFSDSSGALASRFVLLTMSNSFYGREDPMLTDALLAEASGIFNWCLEGLDRLHERGYFTLPGTSRDALRQLEDLSSPIGAFVRDRCRVGPALEVGKDELYAGWRTWCEFEGRGKVSTKAVFLRDLRAALPEVGVARLREGNERHQVVTGLDLNKEWTVALTTPDRVPATTNGQGSGSGVEGSQTRRSGVEVRDGQGSPALHLPQRSGGVQGDTRRASEAMVARVRRESGET